MTKRPRLGEKRAFSARAVREFSGAGFSSSSVKWVSSPIIPTARGMYVGYRKVYDGTIEKDDADGFIAPVRWFVKKKTREVWLFVTDPRQNPIKVLPEDVE